MTARHTAITARRSRGSHSPHPARMTDQVRGSRPPSTTLSDQRLALCYSASSRTMLPIKAVGARCYRNFNSTVSIQSMLAVGLLRLRRTGS